MERNAYRQLLEWKNNPRHKPLILNGVRHVGKTWLLKHFGEKPVEVKAEENLRAKSLRQIVTSNTSLHGLRFSMSNYRHEDWLDNVPLYGVATRFTGKNECFI